MTDRRRRDQFVHVRANLRDLAAAGKDVKKLKFKKLQAILENGYRVMPGVSPARYTAMVKSMALEHTTDEDVRWH